MLTAGMVGRATSVDMGVSIKRRTDGKVDAGYFLIRMKAHNLNAAHICPKEAFRRFERAARWRKLNDQVADVIFKRKGLWGINAQVVVSGPASPQMGQELRLISIASPEQRNCSAISMLGLALPTDPPPRFAFPTPINESDNLYGTVAEVRIRSVHQLAPSQSSVDAAWKGIGFIAGFASASLTPLMDAMADRGKAEITAELTQQSPNTPGTSLRFDAQTLQPKSDSWFVYLGFSNFDQKAEPLEGGVTFTGDYQASAFHTAQFFQDIKSISADDIIEAQIFPNAAGVLDTVGVRLGQKAFDLFNQGDASSFSGMCVSMRSSLRELGLSNVDADAWLWAAASTTSHKAVSEHIDEIACFKERARANLARMNIKIEKIIIEPKTSKATTAMLHDLMQTFGNIMGSAGNTQSTFSNFAETIELVLGDEAAQKLGGGAFYQKRARSEALELIRTRFTGYGCWAPRDGREVGELPLRPAFRVIADKARGAALLARSKDGLPFVISFEVAPVVEGKPPVVSTIAISGPSSVDDDVVSEMRGRPPGNCDADWMVPMVQSHG